MEEGKKFRLTIQLFHCRKVSERFQDMASSSPLNLLPHLLVLLFFIHESQSCPQPMEFHCPDNAYKGIPTLDLPFTNKYMPECGRLCELTCENNISTTINCTGHPMAVLPVSHVFLNNRTIIVDLDHLKIRGPCDAVLRGVSNASFPSSPLVSFTIVGAFETLVKCPKERYPRGVNNHNNICPNKHYIVYAPMEDGPGQYPENHPPGCSSIQVPRLLPDQKGFYIQYNISDGCQGCHRKGGQCYDNSDGKPDCDMGPSSIKQSEKGKILKIILGTVLPGLAIMSVLLIVYWRRRKNRPDPATSPSTFMSLNHTRSDLEGGSINGVRVFSYNELEEATNNFDSSRKLGEGGFGVVYHGKLRDGREVAVKRLYEKSCKQIEQFKNEIRILTELSHPNLVILYGCTTRHSRELILVYEYIPNGTVADHLHGDQAKSRLLPWSTRMNIATGTATALSYLHFNDVIHRDVKTNNILLDNNFSVKVADFGLSRLFPADVTHVSTAPQGTPGYLDPEYRHCYHLTDKSDVYSFGVVLVELISSLPAVDVGRQRHEINLSSYAMNRIQCSAFNELVDPSLGFETDFKVRRMTTLVAELAFRCLQQEREVRPSMEEVLEVLKRIASADYDALEAEEMDMSTRRTTTEGNDNVELLTNTREQSPSPVSLMDKWLNSSKSTTPNTSGSRNS